MSAKDLKKMIKKFEDTYSFGVKFCKERKSIASKLVDSVTDALWEGKALVCQSAVHGESLNL